MFFTLLALLYEFFFGIYFRENNKKSSFNNLNEFLIGNDKRDGKIIHRIYYFCRIFRYFYKPMITFSCWIKIKINI